MPSEGDFISRFNYFQLLIEMDTKDRVNHLF